MSLHAFYEMPHKIDYVIGVAGHLFPFSRFKPTENKVRIIHGLLDEKRSWEYAKIVFENKMDVGK